MLLFLLGSTYSYTQEKTVSGRVSDQGGLPLPGVNILVKGTTSGTQSDFDGNFAIQASEGQILVFSYLGQTTIESTVDATNIMNIQMQEDAEALEEVIVIGYGNQVERR